MHEVAGNLYFVALDVHADGDASETHAIVVLGAQRIEKQGVGLDLGADEGIFPRELLVDLQLSITAGEVLV